jgi:hypothetical protein
MPEAVGDRPMIHTGRHESCGMTMSQVVRTDPRELQPLEPRVVVPISDVVLMEWLAARPAEHEAVLLEPRAAPELLLTFPLPNLAERVDDLHRKRDRAS